jgi:hypothetical protein
MKKFRVKFDLYFKDGRFKIEDLQVEAKSIEEAKIEAEKWIPRVFKNVDRFKITGVK